MIMTEVRRVLEEHRDGILEWLEFAVWGKEDVAHLLKWMRSITAHEGLALDLVQRLQVSDDPEFWEALADQILKAHPDRGRLLGYLMAEAVVEDVAVANSLVADQPRWVEEGGGWRIVERTSVYTLSN
jgi:hypothetical protein